MTTQELKNLTASKLQSVKTEELIATVKRMNNDFIEGIDLVIDVIMDILMVRLPENEFVELCNSL